MSKFYNPRRSRNLFDPKSSKPFAISRSKIDLFHECPRCFYLDRRLGVGRPPGFPFNLNSAVDALLKKEFDWHRLEKKAHPLMTQYGVDAVPFDHPAINIWRENFKGVRFLHEPTNLEVFGAVDDVWVNPQGELIVADYKATSKSSEVNLDAPWQIGYKRQMEVYQWLLRQNGFTVSDTGYFVYANGRADERAFDNKLEFDVKLLPYTGNADWVEPTLQEIAETLHQEELPFSGKECDYCAYRSVTAEFE